MKVTPQLLHLAAPLVTGAMWRAVAVRRRGRLLRSVDADLTSFSHYRQCPYHTYVLSVFTVNFLVSIHEKVCQVDAF
jgi:hypothetical protein